MTYSEALVEFNACEARLGDWETRHGSRSACPRIAGTRKCHSDCWGLWVGRSTPGKRVPLSTFHDFFAKPVKGGRFAGFYELVRAMTIALGGMRLHWWHTPWMAIAVIACPMQRSAPWVS